MVHRHPPHNTIEHTHAKILVSALERQVSSDDTYGEGVNHHCSLAHPSKQGKWHHFARDTKYHKQCSINVKRTNLHR